MLIRAATLSDIVWLMQLARDAVTAARWTEEQYLAALTAEHPRRVILVAEVDRIIGFVVASEAAGEWELENVVVDEQSRRTGVGTRLVQELLQRVQTSSGTAVLLEVRESNVEARKLYENLGFSASGRRRDYYHTPDEDAILYSKNL